MPEHTNCPICTSDHLVPVQRRGLLSEFLGAVLCGLTLGLFGAPGWVALPAAAARTMRSPVTWQCQFCGHVWREP
jgi:hypothetical protein